MGDSILVQQVASSGVDLDASRFISGSASATNYNSVIVSATVTCNVSSGWKWLFATFNFIGTQYVNYRGPFYEPAATIGDNKWYTGDSGTEQTVTLYSWSLTVNSDSVACRFTYSNRGTAGGILSVIYG